MTTIVAPDGAGSRHKSRQSAGTRARVFALILNAGYDIETDRCES